MAPSRMLAGHLAWGGSHEIILWTPKGQEGWGMNWMPQDITSESLNWPARSQLCFPQLCLLTLCLLTFSGPGRRF